MDQNTKIKLWEFQQALTPRVVRIFKIIQGAQGLGILLFAGVVFLISKQPSIVDKPFDPAVLSAMPILTFVHLGFAVATLFISQIVFRMLVNEKKAFSIGRRVLFKPGSPKLSTAENCVAVIQRGILVRSAMFEGVSFFGLVICLLGVVRGVFESHPVYLINAASPALFIVFVFQTFPTKERIEEIFKKRIASEY